MKPRFTSIKNTLLAFATPIRQHGYTNVETLNAELAKRILAMREQSPGERRSNVGGWHSNAKFLQELGEPYSTQLAKMFLENVNAAVDAVAEATEPRPAKVMIVAWANVNLRGDSNVSHIHPGCTWSGVYYVATDTTPGVGGQLTFADPRTAAVMQPNPFNPFTSTNNLEAVPKPGLMVVFPSFLYHQVNVYHSDVQRISIAFNLT